MKIEIGETYSNMGFLARVKKSYDGLILYSWLMFPDCPCLVSVELFKRDFELKV